MALSPCFILDLPEDRLKESIILAAYLAPVNRSLCLHRRNIFTEGVASKEKILPFAEKTGTGRENLWISRRIFLDGRERKCYNLNLRW